mmetsp:Transcript_37157/g.83044  ORF Transcript_37157/g.83044 Transcript_37157/m.83044 type:complete len:250 (+) Transcript_37157:1507-2256(+)
MRSRVGRTRNSWSPCRRIKRTCNSSPLKLGHCARLTRVSRQAGTARWPGMQTPATTTTGKKIQHIIDLKEGNHSLRTELKKARQRIAQLEVACAGEVAAKVAGGKRLSSTATTPPRVQQSLCRPARPGSRADVSAAEDMPIPQDKTLERLSLDFRHVLWLLERAAVNCAGSLSVPPLAESGPAAFLRRLGDLAMAERASAASARSPAGSTSQVPAPTTPDRRQSVLDGLSDLGSEAPDAASDMDLEEAK